MREWIRVTIIISNIVGILVVDLVSMLIGRENGGRKKGGEERGAR
jgi:hypothetical protein